jgi:hypothetical protein
VLSDSVHVPSPDDIVHDPALFSPRLLRAVGFNTEIRRLISYSLVKEHNRRFNIQSLTSC